MWWSDRRAVLVLGLALAGCGLRPVYAPGGAGARLQGATAVQGPATPQGLRLARALQDRLGGPSDGPFTLSVTLTEATVTSSEATRRTLTATSAFRLTEGETLLASGEVSAFAGASTTGSTVATEAARQDAEERLAVMLADLILTRLLATGP